MTGAAKRRAPEVGAMDILNQGFRVLRALPLHVLAAYYVGALPFVLGFLFFWSDMSGSAFAGGRCLAASLAMAGLFWWMKCWQTVFARGVREAVTGLPAERLTPRAVARLATLQLMVQPYGLVLIPVAMLLTVPFYSVYTFFQNVTALGDGSERDPRVVMRRAWTQALLWPRQNHILLWLLCPWVLALGLLVAFGSMWLVFMFTPELQQMHGALWFVMSLLVLYNLILPLCPFSCVVAGNLAIVLAVLPWTLHTLFGAQTVFTLSGMHAIVNTTFLITVYGLSYLCLDPVVKTLYTVRCFLGEAQATGEDILAELRSLRKESADE